MPVYKERRKDVKYYIEKSLRDMGYKVNDTLQEKYADKECAVIFSNFQNPAETQRTYWSTVWLKILLNLNDNNEAPYVIDNVIKRVTRDVESSEAPNCTSFYFGDATVVELGQTYRVEFNCRYSFESAYWADD